MSDEIPGSVGRCGVAPKGDQRFEQLITRRSTSSASTPTRSSRSPQAAAFVARRWLDADAGRLAVACL